MINIKDEYVKGLMGYRIIMFESMIKTHFPRLYNYPRLLKFYFKLIGYTVQDKEGRQIRLVRKDKVIDYFDYI